MSAMVSFVWCCGSNLGLLECLATILSTELHSQPLHYLFCGIHGSWAGLTLLETRAPFPGWRADQAAPHPRSPTKGPAAAGEDREEESDPRAALAHKVVESPFPGGGEPAAPGAGFLPPRAEEEPWVPSAGQATSASGARFLSSHYCKRKTPARACPWLAFGLFCFWRNYPAGRLHKSGGVSNRVSSSFLFFFFFSPFGSCLTFYVSFKKIERKKKQNQNPRIAQRRLPHTRLPETRTRPEKPLGLRDLANR